MTDDLVKRLLAEAGRRPHTPDPALTVLLREAATRLSAQPAEVETVEGVARVLCRQRMRGAYVEKVKSDPALLEAHLSTFWPGHESDAREIIAAVAVRPSGAEMREALAKAAEAKHIVTHKPRRYVPPEDDDGNIIGTFHAECTTTPMVTWAGVAAWLRALPLSQEEEGRT
jgi:hypothetical protein